MSFNTLQTITRTNMRVAVVADTGDGRTNSVSDSTILNTWGITAKGFTHIQIGQNIMKITIYALNGYNFFGFFVDSFGNKIATPYTAQTSISSISLGTFTPLASNRIVNSESCGTLVNSLSAPVTVLGAMIYSPSTQSYMKYEYPDTMRLSKFYQISNINNFKYNLNYPYGTNNRSIRYINTSNVSVNVDIPRRKAIINNTEYDIITNDLPVVTKDVVRFTSNLFSDNSYDYDPFFASNRDDIGSYKMEYALSGTGFTKTFVMRKNGTSVAQKPTVSSQVPITHARLSNTFTNSNVFIRFENFGTATNTNVFVVDDVSVDDRSSIGIIRKNFQSSEVYNKCYLGWLKDRIVPPDNDKMIYKVLKHLDVQNEYMALFCTPPNTSYVMYSPTQENPTFTEYGSYTYSNGLLTLTPTQTSSTYPSTRMRFIDGIFYRSNQTSNAYVIDESITFSQAMNDLNRTQFSRYCVPAATPAPTVLPTLNFKLYETVRFPVVNILEEGTLKYIYQMRITPNPDGNGTITFYDQRDSIVNTDGVTIFGNKWAGYRDTHWKISNIYYKIIQRNLFSVICTRVDNTDTKVNITSSISVGTVGGITEIQTGSLITDQVTADAAAQYTLSDGIYVEERSLTGGFGATPKYAYNIFVTNGMINIYDSQWANNQGQLINFAFNGENFYKKRMFVNSSGQIEWMNNVFCKYKIVGNRIKFGETLDHVYGYTLTSNDRITTTGGYTFVKDTTSVSITSNPSDMYILDENDTSVIEPYNRVVQLRNLTRFGTTMFFVDGFYRIFKLSSDFKKLKSIYPNGTTKYFLQVTSSSNYSASEFRYIERGEGWDGGAWYFFPSDLNNPDTLYQNPDINITSNVVVRFYGNKPPISRYIKGYAEKSNADHVGDDIFVWSSSVGGSFDFATRTAESLGNSVGFVFNPTNDTFKVKNVITPSVVSTTMNMYTECYFCVNYYKYYTEGYQNGFTLYYGFFVNKRGNRIEAPPLSADNYISLRNTFWGTLTPVSDSICTKSSSTFTRCTFEKFAFPPFYTLTNTLIEPTRSFGPVTLNSGNNGFTFKAKFQILKFNNWMRLFDFNNGSNGNQTMFLAFEGTAGTTLRFGYNTSGTERVVQYSLSGGFQRHTVYDLTLVYSPVGATNGVLKLWINGSIVLTNSSLPEKLVSLRLYNNAHIGLSSYTTDGKLSAYIHNLEMYDYYIQDDEAAKIKPLQYGVYGVVSLTLNDLRILRSDTNTYFFTGITRVRTTAPQNITYVANPPLNDYDACFNFEEQSEIYNGYRVYKINSSSMCAGTCRTGGEFGSTPKTYVYEEGGILKVGTPPTNELQTKFIFMKSVIFTNIVSLSNNNLKIPISLITSDYTAQSIPGSTIPIINNFESSQFQYVVD